jgi:hypothetical protein
VLNLDAAPVTDNGMFTILVKSDALKTAPVPVILTMFSFITVKSFALNTAPAPPILTLVKIRTVGTSALNVAPALPILTLAWPKIVKPLWLKVAYVPLIVTYEWRVAPPTPANGDSAKADSANIVYTAVEGVKPDPPNG